MKRSTVYLSLLLLVLAVTLSVMFYLSKTKNTNGEPQARDYEEIKTGGIIHIVTEYNSVNYYASADSIAGLQYNLSKYISNRSGLEVNVSLENNLEASIQGLLNNRYDIIARNIPVTNESRNSLLFTIPIAQNKQVLVQRKKTDDSPTPFINNQLELANKQIYLIQGSTAILRINNLAEEIAEPIQINEVQEYTSEQLIYRVAFDDIDYAVVDFEIASNNLSHFPNIDISTDISFTQHQSWGIRKSSPQLLDSLNIWIADFLKARK